MKFFKEFALVAATTLLSGISTQASASSMVELTYKASNTSVVLEHLSQ